MSPEPPDPPWRSRPSPELRRAVLAGDPPAGGSSTPGRTETTAPPVPAGPPLDLRGNPRRVPAGRLLLSKPRSAGFAVALLLLVAAVPVLGWVGLTMIQDSKAGTLITRVSDPRAPGYEAIVDATPTALLIQKDPKGGLVSVTFLALGGSNGGGTVIFLSASTEVEHPALGVDRYLTTFDSQGEAGLIGQVGDTLKVGMSDVIDVDNAKWAALTAKTAPIRFDNPDTVSSGLFSFPAGPVALRPQQVGPYLAARNPGESDLNRLNRQQLFWQAWVKAIDPSPAANAIPGETRSGIGFYLRTLATGPVRYEPLPVIPEGPPVAVGDEVLRPVAGQVRQDIAAAVPYPTAAHPGARVVVRLLNGADADPIPASITRRLVLGGATIAVLGNDLRFGRAETVIQYRDPQTRAQAVLMQIGLGGRGRLVLDRQGSDTVDVTIILGRDLLPAGHSSSGAARPPASGGSGPSTTTSTTRG